MEILSQPHSENDIPNWLKLFSADELNKQGWTAETLTKLAPDYEKLLLYEGGKISAAIIYHWLDQHHMEVLFLATAPHERRKGYLQKLFLHIFDAHPQLKIWLEYRADNAAAIALYAKCGFVESGRRENYYSDGMDAILMEFSQNPCVF